MASTNASASLSDAPATIRLPHSTEGKSALTSGYTYTVHRGDTLEKVAKRSGMDVSALCALNGMKPKAAVKPGQKIKLVSTRSPSAYTDVARPNVTESVHAVSAADPKASASFVPAVYTAERHDTLSKIAKQRGLDLNALCQVNGLNKNTALKPGQKIQLLEPSASQKNASPQVVTNASLRSPSKQATPVPGTLTANMKPVKDSKTKVAVASPQKSQGIQKSPAKASSSKNSSTQLAKAEKNPKKTSKK